MPTTDIGDALYVLALGLAILAFAIYSSAPDDHHDQADRDFGEGR